MPKKTRRRTFTITKAANALKVSRAAVHLAIKQGRLPAKWGKTTQVVEALLITAKDLDAYRVDIERQRAGKKT